MLFLFYVPNLYATLYFADKEKIIETQIFKFLSLQPNINIKKLLSIKDHKETISLFEDSVCSMSPCIYLYNLGPVLQCFFLQPLQDLDLIMQIKE